MTALDLRVELTQDDLRERLVTMWRTARDSAWDFAELCAKIDEAHGRKTLRAWCAEECDIHDEGRISKLVTFGRLLADEARAPRWRALPMWNTDRLATLARKDPDGALAIAEEGRTQEGIRLLLADRDRDGHHEGEYAHVRFSLPVDVRDRWHECLNLIRFLSGERNPSDAALIERLAAEVSQLALEPAVEPYRLAILSGELRCRECGSWDASSLDRHHVIPRSHQGHEGPTAWLCRECHTKIQPRWREWAEAKGYDVLEVA